MPLQNIYIPDHYSGDSSQDTFSFSWRILVKSDLVALTKVVATGLTTTLVLDTDYTIDDSDVDNAAGGDVVLTDPLPTGTDIYLIRATAKTQLVELVEGGTFPAAVITRFLDRLTMMVQEQQYLLRQTLHFSLASTFKDVEVENPVSGKLIGWNSDLDMAINFTVGDLEIGDTPIITVAILAAAFNGTIPHTLGASAKVLGLSTTWHTTVKVGTITATTIPVEFGTEVPAGGGTLVALVGL